MNVEPAKKIVIELPADERGLTLAEIRRIDQLSIRINRPDIKASKREAAKQELARIEASRREGRDGAWLEQSACETIALAEGRGETVEASKRGAVHVSSRDAIYSLSRKLSDDQYASAVACRDYYESRSHDLGSQMGSVDSIGAPTYDNCSAVFNGVQRAKKLQRIMVIERAIAAQCRARPESLMMFRDVCAYNKPLSVWGKGRAFDHNLGALRMALDVADAIIRGR